MDSQGYTEDKVMHTTSFRSMNTQIDAHYWCGEEHAVRLDRRIREWFAQVERRFSRFDPDSELCRLNRLSGRRCLVSDAMLEVLQRAEAFRIATDGIFDPRVLGALHAAGYRASFEKLPPESREEQPPAAAGPRTGRIRIDPGMKSVQLPAGVSIDLGGIVKSWSVQRLADWLKVRGNVAKGMINAGGDLTVWNRQPGDPDKWEIGIAHPWKDDTDLGVLTTANGSAATSGVYGRRWNTDRGARHHLIDTRSMRPGESDAAQCTVYGPDAEVCEVWAKVICILGSREGLERFATQCEGYEALVFTREEEIRFAGCRQRKEHRWDLHYSSGAATLHHSHSHKQGG